MNKVVKCWILLKESISPYQLKKELNITTMNILNNENISKYANNQGEIHIHVRNIGRAPVTISKGEKIIQFLLIPVVSEEIVVSSSEAELFESSSERGSGGFGSTGI